MLAVEIAREGVMVDVLATRVAGGEGSMQFGSRISSTRRGETGTSFGYSAVISTLSFWNGSVSSPNAGSSIETLCGVKGLRSVEGRPMVAPEDIGREKGGTSSCSSARGSEMS